MFHLDAGIHLQKIKIKRGIYQELYGAGIIVSYGLAYMNSSLAHAFAQFRRKRRGRSFFNHFLVAALDGAFPFEKVNYISVMIADDLKLYMARFLDVLFNVNGSVAKIGERFAACRFKGLHQQIS